MEREEVYLYQREAEEEEEESMKAEEGEETIFPFTVAAFGFFFSISGGGFREVFLRRGGQKCNVVFELRLDYQEELLRPQSSHAGNKLG